MKNIRLTTPTQDKQENSAVELDPTALENWLNTLSSDDIIETVDRLDDAISAFNELKAPAAKRHKLLEIYFAALQKLLQGFDEMRLARLNVSTKQKQQLRHDIVWLYIKLSHGYKIIIKDELAENNGTLKTQELLLTTFRAVELTVISLLYAYRYGLNMPPLTFLELHQLYAFAEYKNIANKPVKTAKGYAKIPTIANFYTLAMVFTSIDPTQYEPYTLEVLFLALQPFLFNCRFNSAPEVRNDAFIYKINIYEDAAPIVLPSAHSINSSEGTIYLDIGNVITEINTWLESNKNSKNTFLIEDELELFPGVLAQLATLRENAATLPPQPNEQPVEATSLKLVFGLQALESMLITKSMNLAIKLDYKTSQWELVSESETHYELTHPLGDFEETLVLGDLVSIVDCDADGQLTSLNKLTYISSLQQLANDKLAIKLELIHGTPQPSTYCLTNDNPEKSRAAQYNGIYLTSEDDNDDYHVLIANRSHTIESEQLLLKTRTSCLKATITENIKQTPCYAFLKIRILEKQNHGFNGCNITSLAS